MFAAKSVVVCMCTVAEGNKKLRNYISHNYMYQGHIKPSLVAQCALHVCRFSSESSTGCVVHYGDVVGPYIILLLQLRNHIPMKECL